MDTRSRAAAKIAARKAARHPEADEHFLLGLNAIFATWTALELAVHHEWGGLNSKDKAERMIDEVYDMFNQPDEVYKDEVAFTLEDHLDESFHTTCEDGSTEEIGDLLITLYRQCGLGDFSLSRTLQEKAALRVSQVLQSQGLEKGDAIDSDDDDEGVTLDEVNDGSIPSAIPSIFPFSNRQTKSSGFAGGGGGGSSSMEDGNSNSNSNSNSALFGGGSGGGSAPPKAGPDADGWETVPVKKGGARKR